MPSENKPAGTGLRQNGGTYEILSRMRQTQLQSGRLLRRMRQAFPCLFRAGGFFRERARFGSPVRRAAMRRPRARKIPLLDTLDSHRGGRSPAVRRGAAA